MKNKWIFDIVLVLLLAVAVTLLYNQHMSAVASEEKVGHILELLDSTDAILVQDDSQIVEYQSLGVTCEVYESQSSGYRCTFDSENGRLLSLRDQRMDLTIQNAVWKTSAELKDSALIFAADMLGDALTGTLQIESEKTTNEYSLYTIVEKSGNIPTGTSVAVFLSRDAKPLRAVFIYGSVNVGQGDVAVMNENTLITQQRAIEIASAAFNEEVGLTFVSCELKAVRDEIFFEVTFTAPCDCGADHERSFCQQVDARTGALGDLYVSK